MSWTSHFLPGKSVAAQSRLHPSPLLCVSVRVGAHTPHVCSLHMCVQALPQPFLWPLAVLLSPLLAASNIKAKRWEGWELGDH